MTKLHDFKKSIQKLHKIESTKKEDQLELLFFCKNRSISNHLNQSIDRRKGGKQFLKILHFSQNIFLSHQTSKTIQL